ncbi:peptide antibiotic transporter SbmA [Maritalea mediterranea]|uniref:Peptide antibiotic transporter SbmA n=1 Tax=Maritalea mediterranea TaxID=2909667 RepID=A0ABS9EA51_9HYPH|nr:peptide antibiotic transporter SbmA [Maritalea mediterranea]MCF4098774.1 peptide antibiotic transporter SbmA [Maritalea mediterranea]
MFRSFFPAPKLFFGSAVVWAALCFLIWFTIGPALQSVISLDPILTPNPGDDPTPFLTNQKVWLYQFVIMGVYLFCVPWYFVQRHRWYWWSVVGSATIILMLFANVQVQAWLNDWYGDFFNIVQTALTNPGSIAPEDYWGNLIFVAYVAAPNILLIVLINFFTSHYVFRWRTAMNFYYMSFWPHLRHVEGASQRIQEDAMRFADGLESLGVNFVYALMTLAVFLPILWGLSQQITALPLIGEVPGSLIWVALLSAAFGTVVLAAVGIKLPGLEFNNQKVEAAYRKELVYAEDHEERAQPQTVKELYLDVQKNYFRLFFHYLYFNLVRSAYNQASNFIPLIALGPSILAGAITLGVYQQVANAFGRVESSLQYLVDSWPAIIKLMSVYKRLRKFEAEIPEGSPLPESPV